MSGGSRGTVRRVEGGRLAYYVSAADSRFWDAHWRAHLRPEAYAGALEGWLGPLEDAAARFLPRQGRVVEAGCGMGQHVMALRRRGYDAEGLDWAAETVATVRALYPELPLRVGDVTQLPVPDGYYAGYISLGVVEHRREGPEPFLREAYRVLRPGGVALISVPFFHALRRLKAWLGAYRDGPAGREFYQYAFTKREFIALLKQSGFDVVTSYAYDSYKGIADEVPVLHRLLDRQCGRVHLGSLAQRVLRQIAFSERLLGHMLLVVCRKPDTAL